MVVKYLKDFEFPADKGFTGSAGKTLVKGYQRNGAAAASTATSKTPTRAQYDAAAAQRKAAAVPLITPVQRRAMGNETMVGGKPGGYAKGGYVQGGKVRC